MQHSHLLSGRREIVGTSQTLQPSNCGTKVGSGIGSASSGADAEQSSAIRENIQISSRIDFLRRQSGFKDIEQN